MGEETLYGEAKEYQENKGQLMGEETMYAEAEAYQENTQVNIVGDIGTTHILENVIEAPNEEHYKDIVFHAFEAANQPQYDGCVEGISLQ